MPTQPSPDDPGALLRAARFRADLSQRELAKAAGVDPSVVARIEDERVKAPGLLTMVRLLRAAGCRLLLVGPDGEPVAQRPHDDARDSAARRWPAHLQVREVRTSSDWWFGLFMTDARQRLPAWTADWRRLEGRTRAPRTRKAETSGRNGEG